MQWIRGEIKWQSDIEALSGTKVINIQLQPKIGMHGARV